MRVGVPKEIKADEHRVGLTPAGVRELCQRGHTVLVQRGCGSAIEFTDQDYVAAGASVVDTAEELYQQTQLIVKVKEPLPEECSLLRPDHLLFAYLHLAADKTLTEALLRCGATCIAYETVTGPGGGLPLLAPMSEVAGRLAAQAGAHHLELAQGGRGVLLGGVPGVAPARVLVIGGGVVGTQAARVALGMGADVTVLDRSLPRLRELDEQFQGRVKCEYASVERLEALIVQAELVIGAVLIAGAAAPRLLSEEQVKKMQNGAVLVDVAIDQGGCFATSRPTTHQKPTYKLHGVVHYCVANIPSAAARTATSALTHATLPHTLALADLGLDALRKDQHLLAGLNIHDGAVTQEAVAHSLDYPYKNGHAAIGAV
ncbi:alanine dehydrogenase [Marinimicrobium sp. ABcell2]|uniref:alanine dehydrogenase n=1 Tax=Marinimicrobium sp. ABcell2 TaxID=3069751 RepID=UPI0027AFED93|nr:alanine dehydrogenase [Marinimicrobium sp. ABcell2]MDQ2075456.1 alanine dehydrogenase [Marinimicrobium sp. ABcell2]